MRNGYNRSQLTIMIIIKAMITKENIKFNYLLKKQGQTVNTAAIDRQSCCRQTNRQIETNKELKI